MSSAVSAARSIAARRWLFGLLWLAHGGCADPGPEPVTFRFQLAGVPETLDPARGLSVHALGAIDRLFDGLLRLDRVSLEPLPELAESYTVSAGGRLYEFHLAPAARFHNGRPIRASDVEYSWHRLLAPEVASPSAWLLEPIAGARDFHEGRASKISGIEAVDPHLLRVRLEQPTAAFLYRLTAPAAGVVPHEAVESLGKDFGRMPVGSGPYRFVEWVRDLRLVLEAAETALGPPPAARRLSFEIVPQWNDARQLFGAGRLDLVSQIDTGSLPELRQAHSAHLRSLPSLSWFGFCFRCDHPPFDDPRVRQALALAIDREALALALGSGVFSPTVSFLPQGVPGHDPTASIAGHKPRRARELLAEAGFGPERPFPKVVLTTAPYPIARTVATFVTAAFAELGVPASFQTVELETLAQGRIDARWDLFHLAWVGDFPDAEAYLEPLFHSRGSANVLAFGDAEIDRLLDAARGELDPVVRRELYRRAESLLRTAAPCVPLVDEAEMILLSRRWTGIPVGYATQYLEIERARRVGS